jgi:hypothetical protein
MIERVIENWLTSTNERGYEIPFCQLLASQGHRVLHMSSHGPQEQGKDVITIAPDGIPCAYQLKGEKDIGLSTWRKIRAEIEELIEIPIHHPSVASDFPNHRAYLVNNGLLKDTVRREIHDRNRVYRNKGLPTLNLILKGDLLKDFVEIHGRFLPTEPADFRRFLELYLSDGVGLLPAQQFSNFLLSVLPLGGKAMKKLEMERALASALILAGYVLSPYAEKRNSISLINGWVILAAHVLAVASKARLPKKNWMPTFELCVSAIEQGFQDLVKEVLERDNFSEGDRFTDGLFYRARMTLVLGYLTAFENYLSLKGEPSESTEAIRKFVDAQKNYLLLWGESAIPVFLSVAWFLERQAKQLEAEQLISSVAQAIITQNDPENETRGLHDPYHSVEAVLRANLGLDPNDLGQEKFVGHSFGLQSAVEWLARRLRRQTLARMWRGITRISFCEFMPEPQWATYLWNSEKGELKNRFPNRPESWKELVARSQSKKYEAIPDLLKQMPSFLLLFLLVYPHRVRPELIRVLDHSLF